MNDTRASWAWPALVAVAVAVPLLVLPLRAAADVWRAPALVPQQLGNRGLDVLLSERTRVLEAVLTSATVATASTAVAVVLAWPAARAVGRLPRSRRAVLLGMLALPLLVPPFATGSGIVVWFLRLGLADTMAGLVAAHLVYVLPYAVLLLAAAFDAQIERLEEAAATLGAGRPARLRLVSLPATIRPLSVAALVGFLVSWSDYGTTLAVGGGRLTLPLILLPFVGPDPQVAAAVALVFLVPPLLALLLVALAWR